MSFSQPDNQNTFSELVNMLNYISPGAVIVSVLSLFLIIFWDNIVKKKVKPLGVLPGALVAVIAGVIYQVIFGDSPNIGITEKHLVSVPEAEGFESFIGFFKFPNFADFLKFEVWTTGLLIATIASLETLLSVEAVDKLDPFKRKTGKNRELLAQGVGNTISGFIGGLPITQVIIRSSANVQSGGRTKKAAIIHGILLLTCVVLIPHLLNLIPLAVLAAVLFIVGYKLASPALFKKMWRLGWTQFVPFIVTIAGVVFTDLLRGILMGLAVAFFIVLRNSFKNSHIIENDGTSDNGAENYRIIFAQEVSFLNKNSLRNSFNEFPEKSQVKIDKSRVIHMDPDVEEAIEEFMESSEERNISVELIESESESSAEKKELEPSK
jgi:MFS superfamily sulfate permease-like transporter